MGIEMKGENIDIKKNVFIHKRHANVIPKRIFHMSEERKKILSQQSNYIYGGWVGFR